MNTCFFILNVNGTGVFQSPTLLSGTRSQYPLLNGMPLNATIVKRKYRQFGSVHVLPGLRLACIENHGSSEKKISFKVKNKICAALNAAEYRRMKTESQGTLVDSEDDTDLCPVDCVKEFRSDAELNEILEAAKETDSLVVVDFYRTACGSCKYIEQGFMKLCKGAGDEEASVIFLKHNVMDEYEEQSEVAERLKIKVVPLFHFYKDGVLVDSFPTRDKNKLIDTIREYISRTIEPMEE